MDTPETTKKIRSIPHFFQDNNLTRKAFLNSIASGLDYIAKIIVTFVLTPLLVTSLGDYFYGTWQFLLRIVGYMSPASGRPTQALKFILAKNQNSNDFQLKRAYVGSTFEVLAIFSPLMIIPGMLLSWFIPLWLKTPVESIWIVRISCALLVLNLILVTLLAIPQAIMEGENKSYKRMGLATLLVFIGGSFTWLALFFNTGIIGVAVAAIALTICQLFFYFSIVQKYCPWFGVAKPNKQSVHEFLKLSGWFMGWNLIIQLMISSDVIILGLLKSVESVTYYTISKYAPETLVTLISMMVIGVLPGLGGIIGSGDLVKAKQVREEMMVLSWLIVTVLGTVILLWNRTFITIWVGSDYYVGVLTNLLIIISIFQFIIIRNDANVIDLTLQLKKKVLLGGISVFISIAAAIIMVNIFEFGIVGVITGIMIGRLILTYYYPKLVGRLLSIDFNKQILATMRPFMVTIILFVFASQLDNFVPSRNWQGFSGWFLLAISVILTGIIFLTIAFYSGLSKNQQNSVLTRIRILVKDKVNRSN